MNEKSQAERNAEIANAAVRSAANKVEAAKGAEATEAAYRKYVEARDAADAANAEVWKKAH